MKKDVPEIVLEYGFDFDWCEKDVWKLDYPTQEIVIEILEWHLSNNKKVQTKCYLKKLLICLLTLVHLYAVFNLVSK